MKPTKYIKLALVAMVISVSSVPTSFAGVPHAEKLYAGKNKVSFLSGRLRIAGNLLLPESY